MSPAASQLCRRVQVQDVFNDHSSVSVELEISQGAPLSNTWPLPSQIPWEQVDVDTWHQHCRELDFEPPEPSTEFFSYFAAHYEDSLTGHLNTQEGKLHPSHCGRASRLKPTKHSQNPMTIKASRPGELQLRTDFVGKAVILWFRQMRRIQSYLHAITAGKMTSAAVLYRIELWTSILHAQGFHKGFQHWWHQEGFTDLLGHLPSTPPPLEQAKWIHAAFHAAFRRFEEWHLRKKGDIIQSKYDRTFKALFQDLREAKPDQIDTLWDVRSYVVVAVRPGSRAALLDQAIDPLPEGLWYVNGCQVQVQGFIEEMIVFEQWPDLDNGSTLIQQAHTRSDEQVHHQLLSVWKPRWQLQHGVDPSIMERATNFVQQFVPSFDFDLPDITPHQWYRSVARLKPQAARGPDGFARLDLLKMPLFYVQILIQFLMQIEQSARDWPEQMTLGIVLALAKHSEAHTPGAYRPIVLFSMIYRVWASLRCRQLLRLVEACIHDNAHGFLPGRETMQSWISIQTSIEMALQSGQMLCGLATDLKKAFNNVQRPQWFCLARRLGIPQRILVPWERFLGQFTRRFQVHGNLSESVSSNVGFAEGDPLSVFGMALIDWSLHIYQDALAPPLRTLTFVDNISLLSTDVGHLALGFFALQAFLQLWGLETDLSKSYAWSTVAHIRPLLAQLGLRVVSDASELGGSLTLGASRRVRLLLQRGANLEKRWQRLRISRAPIRQKLACLPLVFWPAALHGSLGCVFSAQHLHGLRKQAISATGLKCGGSNSVLRLSLASPMTADPGFYHLRSCVFDFRRMLTKCSDLLQQWCFFMRRYTGKTAFGPFYKILDLFSQIGWSLREVPTFWDHDGCLHNLISLPNAALEALLTDAWLQSVSHQVRHRATMADLPVIDIELAMCDKKQMTPADLGRVMALQTGAFISGWQHAKFDSTKQAICPQCLTPATQKHWFTCPALAPLRDECGDMSWIDDLPVCTSHHLLVPRPLDYVTLKRYFLSLEDQVEVFWSTPSFGPQHLFTDGSCFQQTPKITSVAAWAVVNATAGAVVGFGHLPGLIQCISRAELYAVLCAARWSLRFQVSVYVWSDSLSTVKGTAAILNGEWLHFDATVENHDLWQLLAETLQQLPADSFNIAWTPSHLDVVVCDTPQEEWQATWNAIADDCAVTVNQHRGSVFEHLRLQLHTHHESQLSRLRALRNFYLKVAHFKTEEPEVVDLTTEDPSEDLQGHDSLSDSLMVNWQVQLSHSEGLRFPVSFATQIFEAVCELERQPEIRLDVSFVEFTLWLLIDVGVTVPIWDPSSNGWNLRDYFGVLLRPTLAHVIAQVRHVFQVGLHQLGLTQFLMKHLNRVCSGISMPVDGLSLCVSREVADRFKMLCHDFTGPRLVRKAADLARPL